MPVAFWCCRLCGQGAAAFCISCRVRFGCGHGRSRRPHQIRCRAQTSSEAQQRIASGADSAFASRAHAFRGHVLWSTTHSSCHLKDSTTICAPMQLQQQQTRCSRPGVQDRGVDPAQPAVRRPHGAPAVARGRRPDAECRYPALPLTSTWECQFACKGAAALCWSKLAPWGVATDGTALPSHLPRATPRRRIVDL